MPNLMSYKYDCIHAIGVIRAKYNLRHLCAILTEIVSTDLIY